MPIPILFLIDLLYMFSGTEKHLFELATNLDRQLFDPHIVTFQGSPSFIRKFEMLGVPVQTLGIRRIYGLRQTKAMVTLSRYIQKNNVAILQTFHANPDLFGAMLGCVSRVPIVISSRRDMGFDRTPKIRAAYHLTRGYVDAAICVSEAVKQMTIREDGFAPERISVIYNGMDPSRFAVPVDREAVRRKYGIPYGVPVVGVLANLNVIKGHHHFLDAAAIVQNKMPQVRYVIVGDGPAAEDIKRYAIQLNLKKQTHFIGYNENIAEMLALMDVVASTSMSEGFSNTIIEALYARRPVVATAVGGNSEVIRDRETGLLVRPADPKAMANAIQRLIEDPPFARLLAENGRRLVKERFLLEHMVKNTEALYTRLLAEKGIVGTQDAGLKATADAG